MSLRVKLFAAFIVLIVIPLFVLGIAAYMLISDMLEEKYAQQAELALRALGQSVTAVFQETNKLTDSTIANTALQDVFNKPGYGENLTAIDYLELNAIQRNFRELLVNHPSVSYALLYTLQDERVNEIYAKENFQPISFDEFRQLDIYERVMARRGLPEWVGPYEYPQLTGSDPVFTQIRVVKDIATLQDQGILLVQTKNAGLDNVFRYFRFKEGEYETRFFIMNDSGLILYDSAGQIDGQQITAFVEDEFTLMQNFHSSRGWFEGRDSLISQLPVGIGSTENWYLVSVASWRSLLGEITLYARWVAIITALCLILALIYIGFFVNRTARSIVHTVRYMRRAERGDLDVRLETRGSDETAFLARGFNSMIGRIRELLDDVKQEQERKTRAELMLMQAQIQPHFLFNVLESINMLATQNEGAKVSAMVRRLANILRISIRQHEEIRLCDELEHVVNYLEIQKFRFEDLFDYEIDVPDEWKHNAILKLSLQPLVENSIQHGFDGIDYMGLIRITVREESGSLVIMVEDNGIGIAPDILAELHHAGGSVRELAQAEGYLDDGLGLRNVADRIRIRCGAPYGLMICSASGLGTTIRIRIPKTVQDRSLDKRDSSA